MHLYDKRSRDITFLSIESIWDGDTNKFNTTTSNTTSHRTHISNNKETLTTFLRNIRTFEHNPKHRAEEYTDNKGEIVSPLKTSHAQAQKLLQKAIGNNERELFAWDAETQLFVVFKQTHLNQDIYHAYNPQTTEETEISVEIRRQLGQ